jgi:hypothetical protein
MEVKVAWLSDGFEIFDEFDLELISFQKNMWQEVIKMIKPYFLFLKTSDPQNVHNMFAIMLDPCSKSMSCGELCQVWGNNSFCFWIWCKNNDSTTYNTPKMLFYD